MWVMVSLLGCGGGKSKNPLVNKVNADDKNFRGVWVYKSQFGEQTNFPVMTRIDISVEGEKFHLTGKWGTNNPSVKRGTEEWIYDGKVLWEPEPSQKQVKWFSIKGFKKGPLPFWKMPPQMSPFSPPNKAGEGEIVGRNCHLLKMEGRYDQGDVTLSYWIDQETNILLKKEHQLEAGGPLVHEAFECERIEIDPIFSEGTFRFEVPPDWVKVKMHNLDSELLDTKF